MAKQKATEKVKLTKSCVVNGEKKKEGATVAVSLSDKNYLVAAGLGLDPKTAKEEGEAKK